MLPTLANHLGDSWNELTKLLTPWSSCFTTGVPGVPNGLLFFSAFLDQILCITQVLSNNPLCTIELLEINHSLSCLFPKTPTRPRIRHGPAKPPLPYNQLLTI